MGVSLMAKMFSEEWYNEISVEIERRAEQDKDYGDRRCKDCTMPHQYALDKEVDGETGEKLFYISCRFCCTDHMKISEKEYRRLNGHKNG